MHLKLPHHPLLWILTLLPVFVTAQISGLATLGTHPSQPGTQGLEGITVKAYHTNPETGKQELLTPGN